MANFSKSFNFRNGLQVDDDKLIVKPNTGLVGIGSTIPTEVLDVKGNIKSPGIVTSPNIVAGTGITVGTGVNQILLDGTTGFITAKNYFGDGSTLTNVVAIATAGFKELSGTLSTSFSVGIGSLNTGSGGVFPDFTLDVLGDMRVTGPSTFIGITTVSDLFANRFSVSNSTSIGGGATIDQANITGVSTFGGNIDILDDVFLNIGNSDDLRLYHLASGESVIAELGTGNLNILANFTKIGTIAGGVKFETLTTGAKVTGNLQVTGNTDLDGTLNVDSTSTFGNNISVTGQGSFTGNVIAFVSDDRLKTNKVGITGALDKVMSLSGFTYNFNKLGGELGYDTEQSYAGISAQEVQKVLPEAVFPAPADDKYITVQYDRLVPLLIEAIKELKEEVEELKKHTH